MDFLKKHQANLKPAFGICIFLMMFLFVLMLLFFGSSFENNTRIYKMNVLCVDLDGGVVGQAFLAACDAYINNSQPYLPTFEIRSYPDYDSTVDAIWGAEGWGLVFVNPNASLNLQTAIEDGIAGIPSTYDPRSAVSFFYDEGRNPTNVDTWIVPPVNNFLAQFQATFAAEFWKIQFSTTLANLTVSQLAPISYLTTTPVAHTTNNISPINGVGLLAQNIGLILLVVFSFLWLMASHPFIGPVIGSLGHPVKKFFFILAGAFAYTFFSSLGFSSAVACYYGVSAGHFMEYWMLNWLQQLIYVTALSNTFPLLKEKLGLFFCIFLVLNITGGFGNLTIEQNFYWWGYATPFWHAIAATRYILFGGWNSLYIALPCLFAMLVFNIFLLPFAILLNQYVLVPRGLGFGPVDQQASSEEATKEASSTA